MAKLKKILTAVLAASLLTGFSASIASFATDEDMYEGISELFYQPEWFNNAEDYVESVQVCKNVYGENFLTRDGKPVLWVTVRNRKVAEANAIIESYGKERPDEDVDYWLIDNGDSFFAYFIDANSDLVCLPKTILGKPVIPDSNYEYPFFLI